jgi:hypothetical protein
LVDIATRRLQLLSTGWGVKFRHLGRRNEQRRSALLLAASAPLHGGGAAARHVPALARHEWWELQQQACAGRPTCVASVVVDGDLVLDVVVSDVDVGVVLQRPPHQRARQLVGVARFFAVVLHRPNRTTLLDVTGYSHGIQDHIAHPNARKAQHRSRKEAT